MDKQHSIAVWDLVIYKVDEYGEPLRHENGDIKLFTGDIDCSYMLDGVDEDQLTEVSYYG